MENKKNVNIWKTLQKVPAGTMFVPLIIGAIITTICPVSYTHLTLPTTSRV